MSTREEIRDTLDRVSRTVLQKPSFGQRVYSNVAVIESGLSCRMHEKNSVLAADLPRAMGGEDSGPSPSTLFRAAISSCVAMGIKMWAARRDVEIDRVEVCIETDSDARGQLGVADAVAPGFGDIRMQIRIESCADADLLREVVQTSLRYSPMIDVLRRSHGVAPQLELTQPVVEQSVREAM